MTWRILSILSVIVCLGVSAAAAAPTPPGGIYAIIDATSTAQYDLAQEVLKRPDVDGLLIHLRWSDVNPADKRYDWEALNATAALAVKAHKRFEIGIVTGKAAPPWVIERSVHGIFSYYAAALAECEDFTMAVPYDAFYLQAFHDLLHALSKDLRDHGTYQHLGMIKLFGITTTTNELRLPAVAPKGCDTHDPVTQWVGLGYTPDKVAMAWSDMLQMYLMEFPDKAFNIGFIGINAFPGIGKEGHALPEQDRAEASARFTERLIAAAAQAMPGRLALGFDSLTLYGTDAAYGIYLNAFYDAAGHAGGLPLGWQTNELLGNYPRGGAACGGSTPAAGAAAAVPPPKKPDDETKPVPCMSSDEFRQLLYAGTRVRNPPLRLHAVYLELFAQNIVLYPSATPQAHRDLTPWGAR